MTPTDHSGLTKDAVVMATVANGKLTPDRRSRETRVMTDLLQLVVSGLSQGAVYGLVALGFVAIFSVREIVNLAQGEFVALGGCARSGLWVRPPSPAPDRGAGGRPFVVGVSVGVERLVVRPVRLHDDAASIILTLGISTALKAAMLLFWGPESQGLGADHRQEPVPCRSHRPRPGAVESGDRRGGLGRGTGSYDRTVAGKALRACAEQPIAARLLGISWVGLQALSFTLAGLPGALAGVLASPLYFTSWDSGLVLGLKGFVAATLGGLVSVPGAIFGGLLLGVLENLLAGYGDSGLRDAVAFVVLIVVLIRPQGLSPAGHRGCV